MLQTSEEGTICSQFLQRKRPNFWATSVRYHLDINLPEPRAMTTTPPQRPPTTTAKTTATTTGAEAFSGAESIHRIVPLEKEPAPGAEAFSGAESIHENVDR